MSALILSENLYSASQFPQHIIEGSSESSGHEAFRVGRASRSHLNYWQTQGSGDTSWIEVDCGEDRTADMLILDRGSNLHGSTVDIDYSDDGETWTSAIGGNETIPTEAGGSLDGTNGSLTEEGAWIRRFTEQTARYWRFFIPNAAGGGVDARRQIRGLWLGTYYDLGNLDRPWADDGAELIADEHQTPFGWRAAGTTTRRRTGTLNIRLDSFDAYDDARYHVQQRFHDEGRPSWTIYDDSQPERAVLARPVPGTLAFEFQQGWGYRRASVQWIEHQPRFARGTA